MKLIGILIMLQYSLGTSNYPGQEINEQADAIREHVLKESENPPCKQEFSRGWSEIMHVALCKINKLSRYVPKSHSIYYYRTMYKTTSCDEIAQINFVAINVLPKEVEQKYKNPIYISMCIPVNRGSNAWADDRCPFDECTECNYLILDMQKKQCDFSVDYDNPQFD